MQRLPDHSPQVNNVSEILTRAGFQIRGRRATCPFCSSTRKLTVAVTGGGLWYCHRCHRGGSARTFARAQGVSFPAPRIRNADIPKNQFRLWLTQKMMDMGDEERLALQKMEWAKVALSYYPDFQPAWDFIAWFHEREPAWKRFWESAVDRCGRYSLYRAWRKYNAR